MDNYKLTYFNLRGAAEPIRLIFKHVGVPFEDKLIEAQTWPEVKKTIKWQMLPFLEYNGKTLTQTVAIVNFLGNKFGLSPDNAWDQAKCDEIHGAINDLRAKVKPLLFAKHMENAPDRAVQLKQELLADAMPRFLENFNDVLKEIRKEKGNNIKSDFILGGEKPTATDFYLAYCTDTWEKELEKPDLLAKQSLLKQQQVAVLSLPNVAKWYAERPNFKF